jgi:glycosyltransferase involved in cell wall biosynthesis
MSPKVTVLMSVFNGEEFLREAIESVLIQTFADFEFIIIDDASTDKTWEILIEYAERDQRIALVQNQENIGLTKSLNKGLELARGTYIARQDADDISLPDRLQRQVACLDNHRRVVLVSSDLEYIDSKGRPLRRTQKRGEPFWVAWYLLFYNHLGGHSTVLFRKNPVLYSGGYSDSYPYSQDYELWLRLANQGDIVILPDVLLQWREHGKNISTKAGEQQEAWALTATRQSLGQLTGKECTLTEVEELKGFWLKRFPKIRRVRTLHANLKVILQGFLQHRTRQGRADPELLQNLRIVIGKQFFTWFEVVSTPTNLPSNFIILLFAFAWSPLNTLDCCLRYVLKIPKMCKTHLDQSL